MPLRGAGAIALAGKWPFDRGEQLDGRQRLLEEAVGAGQRGGILQLANEGGNATVEAGVLSDGVGVVRAYPLGNPALGLVGMPGTFIMGFGGKK